MSQPRNAEHAAPPTSLPAMGPHWSIGPEGPALRERLVPRPVPMGWRQATRCTHRWRRRPHGTGESLERTPRPDRGGVPVTTRRALLRRSLACERGTHVGKGDTTKTYADHPTV